MSDWWLLAFTPQGLNIKAQGQRSAALGAKLNKNALPCKGCIICSHTHYSTLTG